MSDFSANMLIPLAYEPAWTRINDGVFNDYPPPPPQSKIDPGSPAGQIAQAIDGMGVAVPNASLEWSNPTTAATIPITGDISSVKPFLNGNYKRNLLIIQNSSVGLTTADVAPDLLVNFAARATGASAIRLPPGVGLILDVIVPRDDIYVAWEGGTGNFITKGTITQGSHSPNGKLPMQGDVRAYSIDYSNAAYRG